MEEETVSPSIARSTRPNAKRRLSQAHHSDAASHTIAGQRAFKKNDKLMAGKPFGSRHISERALISELLLCH
jgi:hypothetical protein